MTGPVRHEHGGLEGPDDRNAGGYSRALAKFRSGWPGGRRLRPRLWAWRLVCGGGAALTAQAPRENTVHVIIRIEIIIFL